MVNPAFIAEVTDSEGVTFDIDLNNEENLGVLDSVINLVSTECKIIRDQLDTHKDSEDLDWVLRAERALLHKERVVKLANRRVKLLSDPTGEIRAMNRATDALNSQTREELDSLLTFLEVNYPEVLDQFDSEQEDME